MSKKVEISTDDSFDRGNSISKEVELRKEERMVNSDSEIVESVVTIRLSGSISDEVVFHHDTDVSSRRSENMRRNRGDFSKRLSTVS